MADTQPFEFRWGIISTGWITQCFVKDILIDPKTRDVQDVVHKVAAVGSRTVEKAQEFLDKYVGGDKRTKAYGSYDEVFADKDVDAVYIGTPHTLHYENSLAAIRAKKHVLCEKPVTVSAAEFRALSTAAKENGVFFMEAMWTRFQPLVKEVKRISEEGTLGLPVVVHADLSVDFDIQNKPKTHRILDPHLGGGGLLDLGPYPLVWAIVVLYEHPANNSSRPSNISASMLKTPLTGVDCNTSFTLTFSPSDTSTLAAQAILSTSINLPPPNPGAIIRFERGTILIADPIPVSESFIVQYFAPGKTGVVEREEKRLFKCEGRGWHYQADEVARCVREGKLESELWGHEKSLLEMEIFDEVRRQGGYVFPEGVEQLV